MPGRRRRSRWSSRATERVLQAIVRDVRDRQPHRARAPEVGAALRGALSRRGRARRRPGGRSPITRCARSPPCLECPIARRLRRRGGDIVTVARGRAEREASRRARPRARGTRAPRSSRAASRASFTDVGERASRRPRARAGAACASTAACPILDAVGQRDRDRQRRLDERTARSATTTCSSLASFAQPHRPGPRARAPVGRARRAHRRGSSRATALKTEFLGMMSHESARRSTSCWATRACCSRRIDDGDVDDRRRAARTSASACSPAGSTWATSSRTRCRCCGSRRASCRSTRRRSALDGLLRGAAERSIGVLRRPSDVDRALDRSTPTCRRLVTDRRKLRQVVDEPRRQRAQVHRPRHHRVRATANLTTGGVRLTVRDTGCGIDAAASPVRLRSLSPGADRAPPRRLRARALHRAALRRAARRPRARARARSARGRRSSSLLLPGERWPAAQIRRRPAAA